MENVVLFGIGQRYQQYKDELNKEFNIVAYMDNNPLKQGMIINNQIVISADRIFELDFDKIIVTTSSPACELMIDQMIKFGIPNDRIESYKNKTVNMISSREYDILCLENKDLSYFIVLDANTKDGFSYSIRVGDPLVERKLADLFPEPGCFLDLGANIGTFSLFYASNGWTGHAFEASRQNCNLLSKSIILNDFNIELTNVAISDKNGYISFIEDNEVGFIVTDFNEKSINLSCTTEITCIALDSLLKETLSKVKKIDLIKIDIEGSEVAALRGMRSLLEKYQYPPIYIEINVWALFLQNETPAKLLDEAGLHGYTAYEIIDDKTICEYPKSTFPMGFTTDVILLKKLPDKIIVTERLDPTKEEIENFIINSLKMIDDWQLKDNYILCTLEGYPELYENEQIKEELNKIVDENTNTMTLKAINWYNESRQKK